MAATSIRLGLCLGLIVLVAACSTRDQARQQQGLSNDPFLHIPAATPGPGYEKIERRPNATPTPTPTAPMDRPLDPTGLPPD